MGRQQGKDYARVLGLLKEPTEEEVKRAFRRLALKYHPDKVLTVDHLTQILKYCAYILFGNVRKRNKEIGVFTESVRISLHVFQNDSQWAEEKFKEIAEAYEALLADNRSSCPTESEQRPVDSFKCAGCGKTLKNRHAFKCHLQLYPGHR